MESQSITNMPYRVFTDFHHSSLLYSFILLFEKRFNGVVLRPIGLEWYEQGYWKINNQRDTAEQFLGFQSVPKDGTVPLNDIDSVTAKQTGETYAGIPGVPSLDEIIYYCDDFRNGEKNKAIRLHTFFQIPIDIIIASIPEHIQPFRELCDKHKDHPKLIYQVGNHWNVDPSKSQLLDGVMASAEITPPSGIPFVKYHQEFDRVIFSPVVLTPYGESIDWTPEKNIYSFVNVFEQWPEYWQHFQMVEQAMPQWTFKAFGGQCRDGNMTGSKELADKMRESRFIWHTKKWGDGYGHILHNAFSVGRPVIIKREDYCGKLGDRLLMDGQTAIFIDGLSLQGIVEKIEYYSQPEEYKKMCEAVERRFLEVVDFDRDQMYIEKFLMDVVRR